MFEYVFHREAVLNRNKKKLRLSALYFKKKNMLALKFQKVYKKPRSITFEVEQFELWFISFNFITLSVSK